LAGNELRLRFLTPFPEQFVTSRTEIVDPKTGTSNRSQIVTGCQKHRDPRFRPWVFTEHGALMAANVLRSPLKAEV